VGAGAHRRAVERPVSEARIVLLVGAVQFVNILDFMMVMPLGPDFSAELGIPNAQLGLVGGSYTAAASIAGLAGATFLDRFDRRKALAVTLLGLVLGTIAGGFATGLASLLAARVLAGAFGGPATSLALAIIADRIPPERRGDALGKVMAAFALASVLGVPLGLELSRVGGWRLPFFAVGALGFVVGASAVAAMPPSTLHLEKGPPRRASLGALLSRPAAIDSFVASFLTMLGVFSVVPYFSAYVQVNLHYPRDQLGSLYLVGGLVTLVANRVVGVFVDRVGAAAMAGVGTVLLAATLVLGFMMVPPPMPVMIMFCAFMASGAFRGVALNTTTTKVPLPHERAQFMSTQSAVQHVASACGAFMGSALLTEDADHLLQGMSTLAAASLVLGLTLPMMLWRIGRVLAARDAAEAAPTPPLAPA
jgi:predicted MFS family arabinose efflux permease